MNMSFKKMWNDYGIGAILVLLIIAYSISHFSGYLNSRGAPGYEMNTSMQKQYRKSNVTPASEGQNEFPSRVSGGGGGGPIKDPSELLPKDTNAQWAALNPAGNGSLANMNLLSAGQLIGVNTIGQSLKNANLDLRGDLVVPKTNVGPWNNSTIEQDSMQHQGIQIGGSGR